MKPVTSLAFFLPLLSLCMALQVRVIICGTSNLIEKICHGSEDKNLCYSTYNNNAPSQESDLNALAMIGLNQASENATAMLKYINQRLVGEQNLEPAVEQGLVDCLDLYQDAADQVDDSVAALEADAFKDVGTWIEAAISDAVACQEAFIQNPDADAKLILDNGIFIKRCKNVLAVNKELTGKQK